MQLYSVCTYIMDIDCKIKEIDISKPYVKYDILSIV